MKLFDLAFAPHPRKVNIFIAEKKIDIEKIQVDMTAAENHSEAFQKMSNRALLPVLLLDDGTAIDESLAICRYFEELYPEPRLFGHDTLSRAEIASWERHMEFDGFLAVVEIFRNSFPPFAKRAVSGVNEDFDAIPALAERGRRRVKIFFDRLEKRLAESSFIGGESFSMADITGVVVVDFAKRAGEHVPERHANILNWYKLMYTRDSVKNSLVERKAS
jgi:glutathione S-transferase